MKINRLVRLVLLTLVLAILWLLRSPELKERQRSATPQPGSQAVLAQLAPPGQARPQTGTAAAASQQPVAPEGGQAIAQFQDWLQRYLAAPPQERASLEAEGVRLAEQRRPEFKKLIAQSPQEALRQAVPMTSRQVLPASITSLLEERVNGRAVLRTYLSYPSADSEQPPAVRYAEFESGRTYQAFPYGRRAESVLWVPNASLNGVAMDGQLAVNESPLRVLEQGEIPAPDKTTVSSCPVSGKTTETVPTGEPVTESTPAVEAYGQIIYLCDGSHVTLYEELLLQGEGATGGPQRFTGILPAAPSPSLGQMRVLYIPLTFADQNQVPATEARCYEVMREVSDFFASSSFGRLTVMATVTPPVKLPHNEAWYRQKDNSDGFSKEIDGLGLEHQHAREEARKMGYDSTDYDAVVVRLEGGPRVTGGWGGGSSVWVYSDSPSIVAHELGHCFGLSHANFWDTGGASAIGPGGNQEYGNPYDVMGGGPFPRNHYNAQAKNQIRWLPDSFVQTVTESGVYRISAFDQKFLEPSRRYALRIRKDGQRTYWGEVRALFDSDNRWVANGMLLGWKWPGNSGSNIQLLDTTPSSPGGKNDAAVVVGQTFSDLEAGIHLTTLAVHNEGGVRSVDVMVQLGAFPSNLPPDLTLASSGLNVPANTPVTFSAAATDPEGDAVAYQWLSSDNSSASSAILGSNAPVFVRSFSSAGQYVITCVASDMKGGQAIRSLLVTVGNGNSRFSISGRVTFGTNGLPGVYVATGGNNGVLTDSEGYYSIPNLAAGSYTVTPKLYGYAFSELFNNNVLVGPNFSGGDFAAELLPTLSIAATIANASETPASGRFTITRTGPDSDPLTVRLLPLAGTASAGDYTLSPTPTSGSPYNTVTIPAGADSVNVVVNPANDTAAEGPETVVMELGLDAAYVIAGSASASVVINDNDTTLPKVGITAPNVPAVENPAQPASFLLSRTGPTATNLPVKLFYSGTASNGIDYLLLSTNVTIPAGAAQTTLTINPTDDDRSEGYETVTVTIVNDPIYLRDPLATNATLTLVDDDVQTVSVSVSDATAGEVELGVAGAMPNPGTFLVSRTGDVSEALTLFYALSGSALHGVDYEPLSGSVRIPAGESSAALTIMPRADGLGEGTETVLLQLAAGGNNYRLGATNSGTLTIVDAGDPPYVEVVPYESVREPSTSGQFRFTLKGSYPGSITVSYTVTGTAVPGSDYTALPGTVTINGTGSNNTATVNVAVINNTTAEDLKTMTLTINPGTNYQVWGPTSSATLWVYDDDQPTVFVDAHTTSSSGLASVAENTGTAKFYVSRTGSTNSALTVNYTLSGTASNGVDYRQLTGTTNIPAGFPGVDIIVSPLNDALAEGVETVTLNLAAGSYGRGPGATIYINDDESSPTRVSFAAGSSATMESTGTVHIPVVLNAAAAGPVSVDYEVLTTGSSSPTPANTPSSQPYWFRLTRSNDVFRGFHSVNGSTWIQVGTAQSMALANPVWVGFAVSSLADATLSTASFDNVALSPDTPEPFIGRDVGFVLASGDYATNGSTHSVSGAGTGINGTQDEFYYAAKMVSGDFSFTARLASHPGSSSSRFAGLMVREDMRRFSRHATLGQQGTAQSQFYLRTNSTITAQGAGVDYTFTAGRLTFNPGVVSNSISLNVLNDTLSEPTEQLVFTLRQPTGAGLGTFAQHVLAIQDDDSAPLQPWVGFAGLSSTADESAPASVLVSLSSPSATPVSVDYTVTGGTATGPDDFVLTGGTLTFAPGETLKALPLALVDDDVVESSESIFLLLTNPTSATLTTSTNYTLFIRDNDLPTVTLAALDNAAHENGDTGAWIFTRTGDLSNPLTISFLVGGTAISGLDYTSFGTNITIPAGTNTATMLLVPLADALVEPNESVFVTLHANSNYVNGTPLSGTLTITDANTPVVNIVASTPNASETGPTAGQFTISRSGPTTAALTVNFTVSGTANSGSDYSAIGTSATIPVGQSSTLVTVNPVNDSLTEGPEYVVVSLNTSASYFIGSNNYAGVAIQDNDNPPVVFISQPASKSVQMSLGNGLYLRAEAMDDGAPSPLSYAWSQFAGPGTVSFSSTNTAETAAMFPSNGLYILRISASDGQFTVSDDVTVQVGPFTPAEWIDVSLGSPSTRGKSGNRNGTWTVVGSGSGVNGSSDSAHFVARQVGTNATLIARLTGFSSINTTGIAGIMLRETGYRGARRVLVGRRPNGNLELRTRSTAGSSDTSTTAGTAGYPLWLKIERSNNLVTAFRALDAGGVPGSWTQVGSSVNFTNLRSEVELGFFASNGSQNTLANATFDNVSLTPVPSGPALVSEDLGSTTLLGSSTLSNSTYTIRGGNSLGDGGHFRFQQYVGDVTITARILNHTASGMSAKGGVMVRDVSLDNGPYGMMGIAHYWGGYFTWRNVVGGSSGTGYGGSTANPQWIRIIRKGNSVTAWKASNSGNNTPGTWTQQGGNQVFSADAPIYAGLAVDSSSSSSLNTVQLDNFSVTPGNLAPVVIPGTNATLIASSFPTSAFINATVTEDGRPNPPGESIYLWSQISGPAPVAFTNTATMDTRASFPAPGVYVLRLAADDGEASVFADVTYAVYSSPYEAWQFQHFAGGTADTNSLAEVDADQDGLLNIAEYALGTHPKVPNPSPITFSLTSIATEQYFRIVVPKNPSATDIQYGLEYGNDPASPSGWSSTGLLTEQNTSTNLVVRDAAPVSLHPWRFYRVRLTR